MKRFTSTRSKLVSFFSLSLIAIITIPLAINLPNIGFKGEIVPSATTLSLVSPSPTSSLNVEMSWTPVTPVTNYKVYRNDTLVQTTTSTSCVDTVPGPAWYRYHVIVFFEDGGNSEPSNVAEILIVGAGLPGSPISGISPAFPKETQILSTDNTYGEYTPIMKADTFGNIHLVWQAGSDIYYRKRSTTNGDWSAIDSVTSDIALGCGDADMAIDELGHVHLSFTSNNKIFYKNNTSGSWLGYQVVNPESTGSTFDSAIAIDGDGHVHIAWADTTDFYGTATDIVYKEKTGKTWGSTIECISRTSNDGARWVSLAVDSNGNPHAVWHDFSGLQEIYYNVKIGSSWGLTPIQVSQGTGTETTSPQTQIIIDAIDTIHIVWDGGSQIFYRQRIESTWGATERVEGSSSGGSDRPFMVVDSRGNVHIAWEDYTDFQGSLARPAIFYAIRYASSWAEMAVVSTESSAYSFYPTITIDSSDATHVAWVDSSNYKGSGTDLDVFYKNNQQIVIQGNADLMKWKSSGNGVIGDPYIIENRGFSNLMLNSTSAYVVFSALCFYDFTKSESIAFAINNSFNVIIQSSTFFGMYGVALSLNYSAVQIYSTQIDGYLIGINTTQSTIFYGSTSRIKNAQKGILINSGDTQVRGTIDNCDTGIIHALGITTTIESTATITNCITGIVGGAILNGIISYCETGINISSSSVLNGSGSVEECQYALVIDSSEPIVIRDISIRQNDFQIDVRQGSPSFGGCTFDMMRGHVNVEAGASPTFDGNTYLDYFEHYPFANATTLAKAALDEAYEVITGIQDAAPVYSDITFPNAKVLLRTNLLLELGFNPSNVRLYIDGALVTAATFVPAGMLYRVTVRNATLEITYLDEIRNVNWVSVPQITVLSPANNTVYYGYQSIDVRAHVIDYDDNLASVAAWFNHTTGVVTSDFPLTSVLPYIYNNTFAVSSLSLKGNWTLWVNATDSSGHSTISNSTVIDYRGAPPVVAVTSPVDGSTQKLDFRVNATVTDADGDLDDVWVEVRNATGALKATLPMSLVSPTKYSTIVDIDALLYADGYVLHVKANDTFGNVVSASLTTNFRPKQVVTLIESQITYQVDGTTANTVILATATITNDPVVQSKEVVVYIPATWQDASGGIIRRGSTEYNDVDLADPVKFEFSIPTYQATDTLTFAINTPRFTQVAEEDVNASYIYMEYTVTARRGYTGIRTPSLTLRQMDGEWSYHVELLVGTSWMRVDAATYGFVVTGDYFKSFTMVVPSVGPSETIRLRVVMEQVPGSAVDTTKVTTAIIIAPSVAAGMAVVSYMSPLKKRLPGWGKLLLTAAPAIVTFVLIMI